jgi:hypothetical protein
MASTRRQASAVSFGEPAALRLISLVGLRAWPGSARVSRQSYQGRAYGWIRLWESLGQAEQSRGVVASSAQPTFQGGDSDIAAFMVREPESVDDRPFGAVIVEAAVSVRNVRVQHV